MHVTLKQSPGLVAKQQHNFRHLVW